MPCSTASEDRTGTEATPETARAPSEPVGITRWLLIAIGIYSGLLVTLLNAVVLPFRSPALHH
jgi:hypothetical protein